MKFFSNTYLFLIIVLTHNIFSAQSANVAPVLTASGNQFYCTGIPLNIVTNFNIVDPDDLGIDFLYIQISEGYVISRDLLTLTGNHPTILSTWDPANGKMTLTGNGSQATYTALVAAVTDIVFNTSESNPTGTRKFSITIDQANYLPSTDHYYRFIPSVGISWRNAKIAAENSTYYGLQGYLATITAADESQLAGKQSAGAGWIGGSDEVTEGQWQWMTGPEAGQNFTFTNWNTGEPNNSGNEDYAHITAAGVGILGSWNDLSNTGDTSGSYQPKGFVVEYGGTIGDPILKISAFSTILMPQVTSFQGASSCGSASVTLQAAANTGEIGWYDAAIGGNLVANTANFTTPFLNASKTYYVAARQAGCSSNNRSAVTATILDIPSITINSSFSKCAGVSKTISASATAGIISWFDSISSTVPIATGSNFSIPEITQDVTYYIQADNNGCLSSRNAVVINFFESPKTTNDVLKLCPAETTFLQAQNPNMSYLWNTGEITDAIETNGVTTSYSVVITNSNRCSSTKNFEILYQTIPIVDQIVVAGNTATVLMANTGDFEYSLDGFLFQDSNVFHFSEAGNFTAYVQDKTLCGLVNRPFSVIKFQDFFTPNNDSYNDFWQVRGMSQNPRFEVSIYDRFGRMLALLNAKKTDWDGTFDGKLLPSDDYWYNCVLDNGQVIKGHFSLKR